MPPGGNATEIPIPYCGQAPLPGEVAWNFDPLLIAVLAILAGAHLFALRGETRARPLAGAGWLIAASAFISPLCNLSVALFSVRVTQHMILILVAMPLLAATLRTWAPRGGVLPPVLVFALALWTWHLPGPYDATFRSDLVYWLMQGSLCLSALWLWHFIICATNRNPARVLVAALVTAIQMALLGALLTLAPHPLFAPHVASTLPFGLSQMSDQQLGGLIMWVPGGLIFTGLIFRALSRFLAGLEPGTAAGER